MPWIKGAELFDHCGPNAYMSWLTNGHSGLGIEKTTNVFELMVLNLFSEIETLTQDDELAVFMIGIGKMIVDQVKDFNSFRSVLNEKVIIEGFGEGAAFRSFSVLDLRGYDGEINTPALQNYTKQTGQTVDLVLNHNKRGGGDLRFIRLNNQLDLNDAKEHCGFVHQNGFLACFDTMLNYRPILEKLK
jgi:hypothetical protein